MTSSSAQSATLAGEAALAALELEARRRHRARLASHTEILDAWREDSIAFAAELDVLDKEGDRVRIHPTPMLREFEEQRTGRDIVLKPRQVYFTTWELAHDLHWLLTRNAHVVVVVPSDSEGNAIREVTERINVMLGLDAIDPGVTGTGDRVGLIGRHPWLAELLYWEKGELRFGPSRLEVKGAGGTSAAARKVGRSGTVQRLHITEISSFEFAKEMWTAIEPCVPTGSGSVVIESTAQGAAGLFHSLYQDAKAGKNSYEPFFFAWMKHAEYRSPLERGEVITPVTPREKEMVRKYNASAQQVKWYRAKVADKTQALADQEYPMDEETCWLIAGRLFFDAERVKLLLTETRDPVRVEKLFSSVPDPGAKNEIRIWKDPSNRDEYVIIADPSEGVVGGDPCAAAVYRRANGEHVASVHGLWRTHEFAAILDKLGYRYNTALIVVERVNHGHAVLNALLRLEIDDELGDFTDDPDPARKRRAYPKVYHDMEDEKAGWKTGEVQRATACELFESAVRTGTWRSPDRDLLAEMQRFVVSKTGKPEAAAGAHDDQVLVNLIGWTILSRPHAPKPRTGKSELRYGADEDRSVY